MQATATHPTEHRPTEYRITPNGIRFLAQRDRSITLVNGKIRIGQGDLSAVTYEAICRALERGDLAALRAIKQRVPTLTVHFDKVANCISVGRRGAMLATWHTSPRDPKLGWDAPKAIVTVDTAGL